MIKVNAIKLPKSFDIYKKTDGEKAEFLEPVSKINIFVGSNNSGKSRFMRLLSSLYEYEIKQQNIELETIIPNLLSIIEDIEKYFPLHNLVRVNDIDRNILESLREPLDGLLTLGNDRFDLHRIRFKDLTGLTIKLENEQGQLVSGDIVNKLRTSIRAKATEAKEVLDKIPIQTNSNAPKKIYIPTLRGLRQLNEAHDDLYGMRTLKDYFEPTTNVTPEVFTGLTFYQRLTDLLLGNTQERRLITKYQNFISKKLFEGKSIDLIPNQKEKVVIVRIGNEKEQPIHHLGDGIQSAIILTFLPFVMQEQTFFFIEEPEMFMHPGLQRKILEFYDSLEQHTFFMTTHSNHFLDITIDIKNVSIFTCKKILDESQDESSPDFTIEAVDSGCESSLELLGVRNSSVFLVNATIWVEGITDRWYLRKMLNSYMDYLEETNELEMRLEEDTHYSFVEYGGANITHWSFLEKENHPIEVERLCAKAFVIIDKDGDKKETRKEALEKKLKERLVILPCREIENLLPFNVIKQVVVEYEKNPELELKDYDYSKYQDIYLGKFIEDTMLKKNPSRRGGYKSDSGTLKNKVDFCEKALNKIQYSELPISTKDIIKRIYQFIYKQNINE
jgi:hypothetical protein